jgi:hypothetical protein
MSVSIGKFIGASIGLLDAYKERMSALATILDRLPPVVGNESLAEAIDARCDNGGKCIWNAVEMIARIEYRLMYESTSGYRQPTTRFALAMQCLLKGIYISYVDDQDDLFEFESDRASVLNTAYVPGDDDSDSEGACHTKNSIALEPLSVYWVARTLLEHVEMTPVVRTAFYEAKDSADAATRAVANFRSGEHNPCSDDEYSCDDDDDVSETNKAALRKVAILLDTAFESPVFDDLRQLVAAKLDGRKTEYRKPDLYVFANAEEQAARVKRLQADEEEKLAFQRRQLEAKQRQLEADQLQTLISLKRTQIELEEVGAKISKHQ